MVVLFAKKTILIFLVVLAILVVSSNAAQRARFVTTSATSYDGENRYEEIATEISDDDDEEDIMVNRVSRRMEMMNTNDYGRYNPSPSLAKPRYKLIPN